MKTSKSPKRVLVEALRVAEASLPVYSHRFSPKKFTLHQLFACLVLKDFYNLTYRGTVGLLADSDSLCEAIGLERVPHFTTLQKAADRLLVVKSFRRLLTASVARARKAKLLRRPVRLAAMDTSGFEARHTSRYYAWRRKKVGKHGRKCAVTYRRYPKLGVVCDTTSHFCLAARASQGPQPDFGDFRPLLVEAQARAGVKAVAADAGFDSEANHVLARDELGIQSLIPAEHGRPPAGEPVGRYRKQMKRHLHESRYGQRWQVETVYSMIKRLSGEVVNARTYWRRCRLLLLKTLTHNISILKQRLGFLLSNSFPFLEINSMNRNATTRIHVYLGRILLTIAALALVEAWAAQVLNRPIFGETQEHLFNDAKVLALLAIGTFLDGIYHAKGF
jgi:DDE family transposase